jgi:Ca2+-binding EF-hand superfamily protein
MFHQYLSRKLPHAALTIGICLIAANAAYAQAPEGQNQLIETRFKAADKNSDGKLTLEEAKAGMPRIAANFDKIDSDNKGYLTVDQIESVAGSR